jgi:hypothetical protein
MTLEGKWKASGSGIAGVLELFAGGLEFSFAPANVHTRSFSILDQISLESPKLYLGDELPVFQDIKSKIQKAR